MISTNEINKELEKRKSQPPVKLSADAINHILTENPPTKKSQKVVIEKKLNFLNEKIKQSQYQIDELNSKIEKKEKMFKNKKSAKEQLKLELKKLYINSDRMYKKLLKLYDTRTEFHLKLHYWYWYDSLRYRINLNT